MMKLALKCRTPYCKNIIYVAKRPKIGEYLFCADCKKEHSYTVLTIQADLKMPIKEALIEASMFKSASAMSDFLSISFVSLYQLLRKYYGMSFQEFRRTYVCRNKKCHLINISTSSYSRNDYVLRKIRARRFCACVNALEKDHIMTTASEEVVKNILRGSPKVVHLSDEIFSITPKPVRFRMVCPVYFY